MSAGSASSPPLATDVENAALHPEPWKSEGYPNFVKFVTSDDDFFVLRRFSDLTARVLLAAQDELVELEGQLSQLDKEVAQSPDPQKRNDSFRFEALPNRLELLHEIDRKLRAYSKLCYPASFPTLECANRPLYELVIQH